MPIVQLDTWLPHRDRPDPATLIVLHATAGATARSSINHLRGVGLSYHYIIARDGKDSAKSTGADGSEPIVYHCAPDAAHAFHVGSTVPSPAGMGINKASIGVSLANIQNRKNPEDYPTMQLGMLDQLIAELRQRVPSLKWLTTHAAVQPWNRADPLAVVGSIIARRHDLAWWEPTPDQVRQHKPRRA